MRTTIEIRDDQRARLLELAAHRGEKGFSGLVQEAVDLFLADQSRRDRGVEGAANLMGALSESAGARIRARIDVFRRSWR